MIRRLTLLVVAIALLLLFGAALWWPSRPSIVLISIDTLRADHLSSYGYPKRTSPFIDSMAADGLLFEHAVVPEPQTSPSHASMLTGVTPWKHGVFLNGFKLQDGVDTLPAALRRAGYDTAGVVAVTQLGRSRGFAAGFDRFSEPPPTARPNLDIRRDAETINGEARRAIDAHLARFRQKPMFLFVHYFDCHYPYRSWDKSEDLKHAWDPEEQKNTAKLLAHYDDGVSWVDKHVKSLVGYARARLGDDVIIVITSDHGEQIGDHNFPVGHADIYRETVRVPLIIAGAGIDSARIGTPVSELDLPVALAKLGGAQLQNALDGTDLLDVAARETSWLRRMFGRNEERAFLITGAPTYTRSIALVKGSTWYIKNFDNVYRYARVQTPAPAAAAPAKALPAHVDGQEASYTVDLRSYRPFWITFEHTASSPACAATAMVSIAPGIAYYRQSIAFKQSIRITVPAARLDAVTLTVSPARCAGVTRYAVSREAPPDTNKTTDLFTGLLVPRRFAAGDELYDVDRDPRMTRNLLAPKGGRDIDRQLRSLFERSVLTVRSQTIPSETLQALRSLGYL